MSVTVLRNRLYYTLKPWMPEAARLVLRRWYSHQLRARRGDVWPVLRGSEIPPRGWAGWPQGKKFAVVLTHDVEGPLGLSRCLELMRLENDLGFRSSFNFIPEGSYVVSEQVRSELRKCGFEVGVHDLHHDGKLYCNYRSFLKHAQRINHYLREWDAVGFRSGFMLRNLDWAHNLNILYEASTFDTDPFEPQPEGAGTIFPFWVARPGSLNDSGTPSVPAQSHLPCASTTSSRGYVELPYTLVQDSTLFTLLSERQPDIWFKKVDWLAQNGGMVLVNVHPDYTAMNGARNSRWEYPVQLYRQLLEYLRCRYQGAYWHVTAAEMASWYMGTLETNSGLMADSQVRGSSGTVASRAYAPNGNRGSRGELNPITRGLSKH